MGDALGKWVGNDRCVCWDERILKTFQDVSKAVMYRPVKIALLSLETSWIV
jgi:hypothetical protein